MPTWCLLTGLPIPYSSLGSLVPELFLGSEGPIGTYGVIGGDADHPYGSSASSSVSNEHSRNTNNYNNKNENNNINNNKNKNNSNSSSNININNINNIATSSNININNYSNDEFLARALLLNSLQVLRYLLHYYRGGHAEVSRLSERLQKIVHSHFLLINRGCGGNGGHYRGDGGDGVIDGDNNDDSKDDNKVDKNRNNDKYDGHNGKISVMDMIDSTDVSDAGSSVGWERLHSSYLVLLSDCLDMSRWVFRGGQSSLNHRP